MQSVNTDTARRELSQLLEQVHYTGSQIQIRRNKRPMAWLVSEPFMQWVAQLTNAIREKDPALGETFEIMLDTEFSALLEQSDADVASGRTVPIAQLLEGPDAL